MRLNFNVLWVDDQPNYIQSQIGAINQQMGEEGFEFTPTLCNSIAEVKQHLANNVFTDEIDLILVDWDLGNGVHGDDAIAEIRASIQYKDVVFYSANTAPEELRKAAFSKGIEGVYCAPRGDLVNEVIGVFESLVKKVLDLDHTRGIVMGATSDIDYMIQECLTNIHEKLDNSGREEMLKDALKRINDRINDLSKQADKIQKATDMAVLFEAHAVFTANDRLRILKHALEKEAFKAYAQAQTAVASYIEYVVPERNILGHLVLVPAGKPQAVMDGKGQAISLDKTRDLRKQLLSLRKDFNDLLVALRQG